MLKWQVEEIRKVLKLSKSKRKGDYLVLNLNYFIEMEKTSLLNPLEILNEIDRRTERDVDDMKGIVTCIMGSATMKEWLFKKQQLKGANKYA